MDTLINGGYVVGNQNGIDQKYKCLVCRNILNKPVQLDCGHRICQSCVTSENNFVQCSDCQSLTSISEVKLDKGFQRDMQPLKIVCNLCSWSGKLHDYQNHIEQSHREFKCEHCNEIFKSLHLIEEHQETHCLKRPVHCLLQRYGCKNQVLRGDLETHYMSKIHQEAILNCVMQIYTHLVKTNPEAETANPSYTATTTESSTTVTDKCMSEHSQAVHATIEILNDGTHALGEEVLGLSNDALPLQQSIEKIEEASSAMEGTIKESNSLMEAINSNISILQQDLSLLKQAYEDHQIASYDGTLFWKIAGVHDKMMDARSERQVSIYSPPFFSSPTGYKMRARLYLYGDGNARRTHISLFFVLMSGPYDSVLKFPFNFKVTFCLYDQSDEKKHIIDSFRPDIKSNSFQQPRSHMNIASGIPKFTPISDFEKPNKYIKDDTIFIRVSVDFENTPKTILPYAANLNPALPTHVREKLIRQELQRREQESQSSAQGTTASNNTKKN